MGTNTKYKWKVRRQKSRTGPRKEREGKLLYIHSLHKLQQLPLLPPANTLAGKDKESTFMTKEFANNFIQYANPKSELEAVVRTIFAEG